MIEHIGERHSEGTSISFAIKPIHAKKIQENRHVCEKFDESQVESQNTHFFVTQKKCFPICSRHSLCCQLKKKGGKKEEKAWKKNCEKGGSGLCFNWCMHVANGTGASELWAEEDSEDDVTPTHRNRALLLITMPVLFKSIISMALSKMHVMKRVSAWVNVLWQLSQKHV